jgi:cell division protein FtsL
MIRPSTCLLLILVLVTGFGLFKLKYAVQAQEDDLLRINRQIVADQEAIHVLRAEWSYLNQPARLEQMAKRHLPGLAPVASTQLGTLDALPMRPETPSADVPPQIASTTGAAPLPRPAPRLPAGTAVAEAKPR